jgi:poly-gamma-glutamate synthesis protein (capsule biosynthesis protein)
MKKWLIVLALLLLLDLILILTNRFFKQNSQNSENNTTEYFYLVLPHNPALSEKTRRLLQNRLPKNIKNIIILGPNHQDRGELIISNKDENELFKQEYSIGVVEEELKKFYPEARFSGFIFRRGSQLATLFKLAEEIKAQAEPPILVLASVDFSHYLSSAESEKKDKETIALIKNRAYGEILELNDGYLDCPSCLVVWLRLAELDDKDQLEVMDHLYLERTSYFWLALTGQLPPPTPHTRHQVTLALVGDIGLGREVNFQILKGMNPFLYTTPLLSKADLAVGNLEGPLIKNCPISRSGFRFCGNPDSAKILASAGLDLMDLANNHIKDYQETGIEQTKQALKSSDIDYFDDQKLAIKTIGSSLLGFLGFNDVSRPINQQFMVEKIQQAKERTDFLIISFHWGEEYQAKPNNRQKELARWAIEAGADLVVGHHPHVLQPLEYYQNKPILYSLGNFVFDQMWSRPTRTGTIALVTIADQKVEKIEFVPTFMQTCCQPKPLPEPEKSKIVSSLTDTLP